MGTLDFDQVFREHHDFVWRNACRLGAPEPDDAVQDVFMVVSRRLPEFEGRSNLRTWLFAICYRVALRHRRNTVRKERREDAFGREHAGGEHDPYQQRDAARDLHELLQRLDDDKRAAFIMSELEGMSATEIGRVLEVKTATVYSRIRLARRDLERAVAARKAEARRLEA